MAKRVYTSHPDLAHSPSLLLSAPHVLPPRPFSPALLHPTYCHRGPFPPLHSSLLRPALQVAATSQSPFLPLAHIHHSPYTAGPFLPLPLRSSLPPLHCCRLPPRPLPSSPLLLLLPPLHRRLPPRSWTTMRRRRPSTSSWSMRSRFSWASLWRRSSRSMGAARAAATTGAHVA